MSEKPNEINSRTKPIAEEEWLRIENLQLKTAFHRLQAEIEALRHARKSEEYDMQLTQFLAKLAQENDVVGWQLDPERKLWVEPQG